MSRDPSRAYRDTAADATLRAAVAVPVALAVLTAAGCASADGDGPAAPSPSGEAAKTCRSLHDRLPKRVDGQQRITLDPASKYTAAWGDPAIELRCGVPRPEKLSPGSEHYNPTAEAAEVNGVSWLLEQRDGGYRFTTTDRVAHVEVTVPDDYAPEVNPLTDLARAVRQSVPERR
ncbi:uncharacterized protein DUF3515 [Streptomyces sp. Amel2xB2]|uniref:DUF3515 domain-containing protein n=1 Tax=Streptomyces nanshensis TaxID=518642 RepID=A0A1E7LAX4_9ACTN|nr:MULTISPECIES: DUF3515 domain-containing protein [Streptomyces]OEV13251.1 hypothetical protein AN218_04320 [Streptomyces nanshensis]RAJ63440.1 uncharacterized protein DUF3515 [Streptomyces sp. Amel2xB2]